VPTPLVLRDGSEINILALVDTGSEVNIVRGGLIDPRHTSACGPEIHICAVNKQSLGRDHRRLSCDIVFLGFDQDTGARVELSCPIRAFDAPIDVGMILSYEWLARQNARVYPRKHGLLFDRECRSVWVAGEKVGVPVRRGDMRVCQVKREGSGWKSLLQMIMG
jgi:hypothetical protein